VNVISMTLASALLLGSPAALAQTGARHDPADPRLSVPAPASESAYVGYRSFREEPLADWRTVNDEMRSLGGHAGHIREQAAPADRAEPRAGDRAAPKPAAAVDAGGKHAR